MIDEQIGNEELISQAFKRTFLLLVKRPVLLWLFYRMSIIFFVIFIGGFIPVILFIKWLGVIPAEIVYAVFMICICWYLSALAILTLIYVAIHQWQGIRLRMVDARRAMAPRMRSAMLVDIAGTLQIAIFGLLSIVIALAPNFISRYALQHHNVEIHLPKWLGIAIISSCLAPIFSAYTALTIRRVALYAESAKTAFYSAHLEITQNLEIYRYIMLFVGLISFFISVITHSLTSTDIHNPATIFSLFIIPLSSPVISIFQLLPFISVAERLKQPNEGTLLLAVPPAIAPPKNVVLLSIIKWVFVAVGFIVVASCAVLIWFIFSITGIRTDQKSFEDIQRKIGLMHIPKGYIISSAATPSLLSVHSLMLELSSQNNPAEATLTVKRNFTTDKFNVNPQSHSNVIIPPSCRKFGEIPLSGQERQLKITEMSCTNSLGKSERAEISFRVGAKYFGVSAVGQLGPDTITAMEFIVDQLYNSGPDLEPMVMEDSSTIKNPQNFAENHPSSPWFWLARIADFVFCSHGYQTRSGTTQLWTHTTQPSIHTSQLWTQANLGPLPQGYVITNFHISDAMTSFVIIPKDENNGERLLVMEQNSVRQAAYRNSPEVVLQEEHFLADTARQNPNLALKIRNSWDEAKNQDPDAIPFGCKADNFLSIQATDKQVPLLQFFCHNYHTAVVTYGPIKYAVSTAGIPSPTTRSVIKGMVYAFPSH